MRTGSDPGRRGVMRGLALVAAGMGGGLPRARVARAEAARAGAARFGAASAPLLNGSTFALDVGPVPVNFTGAARTAVGVNGLVPGPILRWHQGDTVTLAVTNWLDEPTSIHWHGVLVPAGMDGVPGFSFPGIAPGETFTYQFLVKDSGTYWYHGHSAGQELLGLYGAMVVEPRDGYRHGFERDYVVLLSDWSDETPSRIVSNLRFQNDYYNRGQRTVGTFVQDARRDGLGATLSDRLAWGRMRMSPADLLDVTGATYTYLMNGQTAAANWTALFRPGERVRLRFINAAGMTLFDVRVPGLTMTVVASDGSDVQPVSIDEFRIGPGETYDVIVRPDSDRAFAIFAQALDRGGYVSGTLAPRPGMTAAIPAMDVRPRRTMADMGMAGMEQGEMEMTTPADAPAGVAVDNVALMPVSRLHEPGIGLMGHGRRVLTYADLRSVRAGTDARAPTRELTLHLTGNMQRYMWGFDGKAFSEAGPIPLVRGERLRVVLINDTMMEHPIHLHGLWSELENEHGERRPYKHTIIVKPAERLSFLVTADEPGRWAFHCHLLLHMDQGMFREVRVS